MVDVKDASDLTIVEVVIIAWTSRSLVAQIRNDENVGKELASFTVKPKMAVESGKITVSSRTFSASFCNVLESLELIIVLSRFS